MSISCMESNKATYMCVCVYIYIYTYMNAEEKVVDTVALNVLTAGNEIQSNPKSFHEISIIPLPFHQKN